MDHDTIQALVQLNNRFYGTHHESFAATRQQAWPGWKRVVEFFEPGKVLDIACGNLRFERFLESAAPDMKFDFTCVDSCAALAHERTGVRFIEKDVIMSLMRGEPIVDAAALFDAAVSFGFMHHIPTFDFRLSFMRALLESVKPGGIVALSFWRFMDDEKLASKAVTTTERGVRELGLTLDEGDYLLGWNEEKAAYRYCHNFTDSEIDDLLDRIADAGMLLDRFSADGRNSALNGYVVLRRQAIA